MNMECKDYREQFTSLLTDTLGQAERSKIETHLAGCADCRREFEAARKIWDLMGDIPQPEHSENMRAGFDSILSNFKEELVVKKNPLNEWITKLTEYWSRQAQPRLAFSLLLVALGLFCGYILHKPDGTARSYNRQID